MSRKLVALLLVSSMTLAQVQPILAQVPVTPPAPAPAPPATSPANSASGCTERGRDGPFAIGFVSGVTVGLVATAVAWAFQGEPEASAQQAAVHLASSESGDPACRLTYSDAFGKEGKKKKRAAALTGGLIGTAVLVVVVVAASSSSSSGSGY